MPEPEAKPWEFRFIEPEPEFMRAVTTPTVTVVKPYGHTLTFEAKLPEKERSRC
jgi:hypothetical protein